MIRVAWTVLILLAGAAFAAEAPPDERIAAYQEFRQAFDASDYATALPSAQRVVELTRRLLGAPWTGGAVVAVGAEVGPAPMVAVNSGVVTPPPRMEYRYGVFLFSPRSVNVRPVTVAIGTPERSTS